jgi:predicted oxidoreductase
MSYIERVPVANGGLEFSKFIQGYWRMADWGMNTQEHLRFIQQHIDLGITTVDHAHVYGPPPCEQLFGEALKLAPSVRDQLEIVTKFGIQPSADTIKTKHYNSDANSIVKSVDLSLRRMGIDTIDVLLVHRPDLLMNADEISDVFKNLEKSGKVKHFGVSNFSASQFELLQSRLDKPLVTNQIEINPVSMQSLEDGTLDYLQQRRVIPMAWSCLAGGSVFTDQSAYMQGVREVLVQLTEEVGADSIDQLIYAWVLALPSKPLPIIGSGNIDRVKTAVKAADIILSREQWYRIWSLFKGRRVA